MSTSTLTPHVETPPEPPKGERLRRAARIARTTVVVLLLIAAAVAGGGYVVRERVAERSMVDAGTAVLSADPVMVGSADAGVIAQALVAERDSVTAGQLLARVRLTANGGKAAPVQEIRAPGAGVVTSILGPGAVARAGEPVAVLYDPAKLVFTVPVPLETLRKLRLGMRATVRGPGLSGPVTATLAAVKPEVDGATGADGRLTVVLRPEKAALATVRTLVPGLSFAVTVDTTTAPGGTPAVNSA
ncbi:HlyD family efflux transporter periplasmic adaptor subunit [Actinoplanes sp. CA-030573]|uniref:HlyD family efflux transporter periplasmic adaptor subunit n=1 Tax=Actinoplanes sp. CA-030573 TaxID=3239898 RepID=UPI003D92FD66